MRWPLVNFLAIAVMCLGIDVAISLHKHDWYTSDYWLAETGKATLYGLWMGAIAAFAEHRKRHTAQTKNHDRVSP